MRTWRGIWSTLLILLLVSCGDDRADAGAGDPEDATGETLNVFNWTDYIGQSTIPSFEQETGASVVYDNYASNEELIAALRSGSSGYDVIFPSGYAAEILLERGLLARLEQGALSNLNQIPDQFASPSFDPAMDYCVPYTWSTTGIGYNSERVTREDAKAWTVLFDGTEADRIFMLDDMRATLGMALKSLGYSVNSRDSAQIWEAAQILGDQRPSVHVYADANIPQLFASEEVTLGYGWSGDIRQAAEGNPAVEYVVPESGTLVYVDYMCIPAGSSNRSLATEFINHVLDPEVSLEIAERTAYATTNAGAMELAEGGLRELWVTPGMDGGEGFEFVENVDEAIRHYDAAWRWLRSR